MRAILTLLSALISFQSMAQEIGGKVIDEKREPMISAVIQVYAGGVLKGGSVTDYDGNYVIKPFEPGFYDVLVIYSGYDSMFTNKVLVSPDQLTIVNFNLSRINGQTKTIIKEYKKPLVDRDVTILRNKEIREIPGCGPFDIPTTPTCILYQAKRGQDVNVGSGRITGTLICYDSVQVATDMGIDRCECPIAEIETVDPGTFVFHRDQLSRMIYRDLNDLLRSIPENTQYGFDYRPQYNNNSGYSYIVDGMHLLNR